MQGFTPIRLLTSTARWLGSMLAVVVNGLPVIITPPFLSHQLVITSGGLRRVRLKSYFDWATLHEIFNVRSYDTSVFPQDSQIQESYERIVLEGQIPLIVDAGCNIGLASLFYKIRYPKALVVGLEPHGPNAALAMENLRGLGDTEVLSSAIHHSSGALKLEDPGLGNNAFRTVPTDDVNESNIVAVSVPDLLQKFSHCSPFIMKLDIEGFEQTLFEKKTSWIDEFEVVAIELHDWMLPGQAISRPLLRELGVRRRDTVFRGENLFSIRLRDS